MTLQARQLRIGADEGTDVGQDENARSMVDVDNSRLHRRDLRGRIGIGQADILVGAKRPSIDREVGELHLGLGVGKGYRQPRGIDLAEDAVYVVVPRPYDEVGGIRAIAGSSRSSPKPRLSAGPPAGPMTSAASRRS